MYVCLCRAVTDREILEAVDAGNHSVDSVGESTGAGTCCGGCREYTKDLIDARVTDQLTYAA